MSLSVVLSLLKIASTLFGFFQQQKWISEGQAIEVAKASAEILRKSGYAKKALEEASGMSDDELDRRLREFEPGAGDKPSK